MTSTPATPAVSGPEKTPPPALSSVFAWDNDMLVVTDPAWAERLRRPALSPSTAAAMESCIARWAIERSLPDEGDPFGAAEIGTSAHLVLEDLFQLPHRERTEQKAMNILLAHSREMWPDQDEDTFAKRGQWIADVNNAYRGLWEIEDPRAVAVRQTEMKFEGVEVEGVPVVGFIDRVDQVGASSRVVDYKSGKQPSNITRFGDKHGDQMRIYSKVVEILDGEAPTEAVLYYTRHGKARVVPIGKPAMSKTLKAFTAAWETMNKVCDDQVIPTKVGPLCGWCPAVNCCPVGQAHGKVDRTDLAVVELGIPTLRPLDDTLVAQIAAAANPAPAPAPDSGDFGSAADPDDTPVPAGSPAGDTHADVIALAVGQLGPAAHGPSEAPNGAASTDHHGADMSQTQFAFSEDKPFHEIANGTLNGASYASTAVFGLASLAYDSLHTAGIKIDQEKIDAMSRTFAYVVLTAQRQLSGSSSYQDGLNTRLRGALRSVLDAYPLPFGKSAADWDLWVRRAVSHCASLANAAHRLYEWNGEGEPWNTFAVGPVASATVGDFIA